MKSLQQELIENSEDVHKWEEELNQIMKINQQMLSIIKI